MYGVADFQSCSFDMASGSGKAVDMHRRSGQGGNARACGRNEWEGTKNRESDTAFAYHHVY